MQIAGGSGLTPMLQVAYEILKNPADKTDVTLIFANVSDNDIILREKLEEMEKEHSNFHVHHVVSHKVRSALLSSATRPAGRSMCSAQWLELLCAMRRSKTRRTRPLRAQWAVSANRYSGNTCRLPGRTVLSSSAGLLA